MTLPTGEVLAPQVFCPVEERSIFGLNYIVSQQYSLVIVVYSYLYRQLYAFFVRYVRFNSKSVETLSVTFTVIFVYSLNYGYLYLMTPFNRVTAKQKADDALFIKYGDREIDGLGAILRQGIYMDFSAIWFSDIGSLIVSSYLVIIIVPALEYVGLLALRCLMRAWDQRKCCLPRALPSLTRKSTIMGYKALYEGDDFDIEIQYA